MGRRENRKRHSPGGKGLRFKVQGLLLITEYYTATAY